MNIGMAEEFCKLAEMEIASLEHPRLCLFSIIFCCSGWCGESHTLPYLGYATDYLQKIKVYHAYQFNFPYDVQVSRY